MTDEHAKQLLDQQQIIIEKLSKSSGKDMWDKLAILSTFLSSIVIGIVGIYFTTTFKAREITTADAQVHTAEAQVAQRFIPDLSGQNENAKKGALLILSTLSNKDLAFKLGAFYASEGTIEALDILFKNAEGENKVMLRDALIDALFARAASNYTSNQNYEQTLSDCKRILELKKENELRSKDDGYFLADFYRFRGYAYWGLEQNDLAEADYRESLKIIPDYFRAYWELANFYWQRKDSKQSKDQALNYYNQAIQHAATTDIYLARGRLYFDMGKLNEALADYEKYIKAYPYNYQGFYEKAKANEKKQQRKEYEVNIKKALSLVEAPTSSPDATFDQNEVTDIKIRAEEIERQKRVNESYNKEEINHNKEQVKPRPKPPSQKKNFEKNRRKRRF